MSSSAQTDDKLPSFGHSMLRHFFLEDGFVSLNHGSYGTYPLPVRDSLRHYQELAERNPDFWMRQTMHNEMSNVRSRLGAFLNCDPDELALVANTSAGVNAVLRSMSFRPGDKILYLSTVYEAMGAALEYLSDTNEQLSLIRVDVEYPLSDGDLVAAVERAIEAEEAREGGLVGGQIKFALIDALSSTPGVRVPFERLIRLLRQHSILSLVDGAHSIGQIPLDLQELNPDFLVTNCHKWLYSARGSAVLYVPKRWQASVHPTSIALGYKLKSFQAQFEWSGTIDFSNYLTIPAALDFRASIGGESRIQSYCHELALEGGQLAAEILGTEVMENAQGTLTALMVNVRLPLTTSVADEAYSKQWHYMLNTLLTEFRCFASPYRHRGQWWVRMCAQIYNEISDFEFVARAFKVLCERLESVGGDVDKL